MQERDRAMVMSEPGAPLQLLSVLMPLPTVNTEDKQDLAEQSWPCPSLTGHASHLNCTVGLSLLMGGREGDMGEPTLRT